MNYNKVVSGARDAARNVLRLKATNACRDRLLELNSSKTSLQKRIDAEEAARAEKLAQLAYDLEVVDARNPSAEKIRASIQAGIDNLNATNPEAEARTTRRFAELDAEIAAVQKEIADIQSGESKVCKEELSRVTEQLLESWAEKNLVPTDAGSDVDPDAGVVSAES